MQPTLVFDGYCNLCSGLVQFLIRTDRKKQLRFIAGQTPEGEKLLESYRLMDSQTVVLIHNGKAYTQSEAVLEVFKLLPAPWKWLGVFRFLPAGIRNRLYKMIAANRFKIFGRRSTCYRP